jgi:phosphohistidine phosphatase
MVKTLLVFRHAKSSRKDDALDDHDRPLNKRGHQTAPRMGQWIAQQHAVPELILSSTAKRAKSTTKKAAKAMGYEGDIRYDKSLYLAPPNAYLDAIRTYATAQARVMVVGHNPGLEQLMQTLTGTAKTLPTAALAEIRLDIESWQDLQPNTSGELSHLWLPRELFK